MMRKIGKIRKKYYYDSKNKKQIQMWKEKKQIVLWYLKIENTSSLLKFSAEKIKFVNREVVLVFITS